MKIQPSRKQTIAKYKENSSRHGKYFLFLLGDKQTVKRNWFQADWLEGRESQEVERELL
jgi:hypothetical protein